MPKIMASLKSLLLLFFLVTTLLTACGGQPTTGSVAEAEGRVVIADRSIVSSIQHYSHEKSATAFQQLQQDIHSFLSDRAAAVDEYNNADHTNCQWKPRNIQLQVNDAASLAALNSVIKSELKELTAARGSHNGC